MNPFVFFISMYLYPNQVAIDKGVGGVFLGDVANEQELMLVIDTLLYVIDARGKVAYYLDDRLITEEVALRELRKRS